MNIPDDLYSYLKKELSELAQCAPEAGAVAWDCEDLFVKLNAAEQGKDWKKAGYGVDA